MDLNEIISNTELTSETLSEEQKTFLTENALDLSDDDAKRFGIDNTPKIPDPVTRGGEKVEEVVDEGGKSKEKEIESDEDEDDEEIENKKRIAKEVERATAPMKKQYEFQNKQLQEQRDVLDVDGFIRGNVEKFPIAGKYREAMLKYMKVYTNVPADAVFKIVAGDELMRIGAAREREASAKANGSRIATSQARGGGAGKKDWSNASAEEIKAKKAEVLGRP